MPNERDSMTQVVTRYHHVNDLVYKLTTKLNKYRLKLYFKSIYLSL